MGSRPTYPIDTHTKVNTALNKIICLKTVYLQSTPVPKLYIMDGITPQHIRRKICMRNKKMKQVINPMYRQLPPQKLQEKVSLRHL